MESREGDWDDLPGWVRDFLDKTELTELVWSYFKKRLPYETFKDWTFEELRAIKFRANVLNRSEPSQTSPLEPLPFLYSPDDKAAGDDTENSAEKSELLECESELSDAVFPDAPSLPIAIDSEQNRAWLESLIYSSIQCPDLVPRFCANWTIDEIYDYARRFCPFGLPTPPKKPI
jgi:hypothetical protein